MSTSEKNQTVDLIVQPGVTLTCKKGIGCGYDDKKEFATLNIYGTGKIVTTGQKFAAGIGGKDDESNGYISIHGTEIEATGGKHAAGIGGGEGGQDPNENSPTITIYAGKITATGGVDGAGIGGGAADGWGVDGNMRATITIDLGKNSSIMVYGFDQKYLDAYNNGKTDEVNCDRGAGIGAGYGGNVNGEVVIKGDKTGNLEIWSGRRAAGIGGGGENLAFGGEGGDVYIGG